MSKPVIDKCGKLIKAVGNEYDSLLSCYEVLAQIRTAEKLIDATEKLALTARRIPDLLGASNAEVAKATELIGSYMDIRISSTPEGWLKVFLPMLCHRKNQKNAAFIREPLRRYLCEYFKSHESYRIRNGVIIFVFCYENYMPKNRCFDYDNISNLEIKGVVDDITLFTFPDDGPFDCSRYFCAKRAEKTHTEVYIISQNDFSDWIFKFNKSNAHFNENNGKL